MRPVWVSLLAGLVLAGAFGCAAPAAPPVRGAEHLPRWEVDGYGRTPEAAEQIALERARAKVEEYLRANYEARFGWRAPESLLRPEDLRQKWGVVVHGHKAEKRQLKVVDGDDLAYRATAQVQITPQYQAEVNRLVREHQVLGRHLIAVRVLAGLVIVLVVVAGYLRLEEATRGYYTTLLRASAAGILLLTAGALWLSF
jgi:hypothetical protein